MPPLESWVMAEEQAPWPEIRHQIENGHVRVTPEYFAAIPNKERYSDFYYWLLRLPYIVPHHNKGLFSHRILMWFRYSRPLEEHFADCLSNPNFDPVLFIRVLLMAAARSGAHCSGTGGSRPLEEALKLPLFERLFYTDSAYARCDWMVAARAAWRQQIGERMDLIRDDLMSVAWAPERLSWCLTLDERARWTVGQ